ncbi:MAG: ubiquinone/menaquinone biosynthesis methyltransferase [marine benthic group bacterium]|nr:ubiquinone/menaquinone biosynthesis methyltransferase [Candidatus Benthicola marisminoris]
MIVRIMAPDPMAARIQAQIDAPTSKRRYVRSLFGRIAGRYDLTNDLMSLGRHRAWKRLALGLADIQPGHVVLDLAAGTGDFAIRAAKRGDARAVIAADLTWEMLARGKTRADSAEVQWIQCDATYLPLPDRSVDRVLVGYGLRNFPDLNWCLGEVLRCLTPGGKLVSLDFGRAEPRWLDRWYLRYLDYSTSAAGWVLHRDVESYRYIPESLRRYPAQRGVTELMQRHGFVRCGHIDLVFGSMAINFGQAPG